jgi:hypothetical protein
MLENRTVPGIDLGEEDEMPSMDKIELLQAEARPLSIESTSYFHLSY